MDRERFRSRRTRRIASGDRIIVGLAQSEGWQDDVLRWVFAHRAPWVALIRSGRTKIEYKYTPSDGTHKTTA
jgi:hypothetical protein